jgi:ADP-ribosyl-[dinitrogen reductase] hydrolase
MSQDRYAGALLGLAVGDALGTTLEFKPPGTFDPITDMIGGGPFDLPPGYWTDDTSMALCLAESLIACQSFNAHDQMTRYCRWWHDGHLSSTGTCFDIGNTVIAALHRFVQTGDPMAGSEDPRSAGNGSLMRLAPIPLAFSYDPALAIEQAAVMSRTTHAAREAVDACRYYTGLTCLALAGADKDAICAPLAHPVSERWPDGELGPAIATIAAGSFKNNQPPDIRGTGYVVKSLEAALWAFWRTDNFRAGALAAANLGDDADTTAAIYGQLAGAYYGGQGLPKEWVDRLAFVDLIRQQADQLAALAVGPHSESNA